MIEITRESSVGEEFALTVEGGVGGGGGDKAGVKGWERRENDQMIVGILVKTDQAGFLLRPSRMNRSHPRNGAG